MKLRLLAVAVAMASVPFAAQAEFSVGGDVTVSYFDDGEGLTGFGGKGSEVTFDASEKVGSLTYFGHFEVNVADQVISSTATVGAGDGGVAGSEQEIVTGAGQLSSSDMYVGVRGGFGEVRLGNTDNGCDVTDVGGVLSDVFVASSSGGCGAGDNNNITYFKTTGAVTYAVSYSPDADSGAAQEGEDVFAVGAKGKFGPATVSLGYESETGTGKGSNVVLGLQGAFGPVSIGFRANEFEDSADDAPWGVSANYSAGKNTVYGGFGDDGSDTDSESVMIGYQRAIGEKTVLIAEVLDKESDSDEHYALGFKHSF